jgi:hypothetical protein
VLKLQGKAIRYDYDQNRLIAVHYPDNPDNDVSYIRFAKAGSAARDCSSSRLRAYPLVFTSAINASWFFFHRRSKFAGCSELRDIPPHTPEDHFPLKMTAFEFDHCHTCLSICQAHRLPTIVLG